jgi:hypothetical protein
MQVSHGIFGMLSPGEVVACCALLIAGKVVPANHLPIITVFQILSDTGHLPALGTTVIDVNGCVCTTYLVRLYSNGCLAGVLR